MIKKEIFRILRPKVPFSFQLFFVFVMTSITIIIIRVRIIIINSKLDLNEMICDKEKFNALARVGTFYL